MLFFHASDWLVGLPKRVCVYILRRRKKSFQLIYYSYGIMRKEYILWALWRPKNLLRALHQNMLLLFIDIVKCFFMYFNVLFCFFFCAVLCVCMKELTNNSGAWALSAAFFAFSISVGSWNVKISCVYILKKREYKFCFFLGIWRFIACVCVLNYGAFAYSLIIYLTM